ncbi:MAG: hypothetical protein KDK70_28165, partial [Myxococcales bacterium]|nr:hypothetical protein [Myxococcales bacterium]
MGSARSNLWLLSLVSACQLPTGGNGSGSGEVGSGDAASTSTGTTDAPTSGPTSAGDADGNSGGTSQGTTSSSGGASTGDDTGPAADCTRDNGGCDPNATCDDRSGAIECTCNPGYEGDGQRCSVAASLPTLRIELPCQRSGCGSAYCEADGFVEDMGMLAADPTVTFAVTLRLRGVVEEKAYSGGVSDGLWNEGGSPVNDPWNIYALTISDPAQTYYLNAGAPDVDYCTAVDYEQTVSITGGAQVVVSMTDTNQCATV